MSVKKSLAWAFSSQVLTFVVGFGGSVAVARLLSPSEMGVYAVAVAIIGVLSLLSTFGISSYITREVNMDEEKLSTAFTVNAAISVFMSLLIFCGSFLAIKFSVYGVGVLLKILALQPIIGIFEFRPNAMMQRTMNFRMIALIGTPCAIVNVALTVILALLGYSYLSMAIATLIVSTLSAIAYNIFGIRYSSLKISWVNWQDIVAFGLKIMSVSGVAQVAQRVSDLVVAKFLGVEALGLYSRASNLSNMIFFNIYGTATRVVFVKMSDDYRKTGDLRATFMRSLEMIISVMWPLLMGIATLSGPLIFLLYGDKWMGAALPLSILMIAQCIVLSFGMNWELFVLRDEVGRQTKFELVRAVFGVVSFAIGALFSISAAAVGRVVESIFGLVLYYPHVQRLAHVKSSDIIKIYGEAFFLSIVAVAPAFGLMWIENWSPRTSPFLIAAAVVFGISSWCVALWRLNHPLYVELMSLIRRD